MTTKETQMSNETKNRWLGLRGGLMAAGVLALGALLQGCFGDGGGPPPSCNGSPAVAASWTIDVRATGQPLSCGGAGADTVELVLSGQTFDAACGDGQILTTALNPGTYDADFTLLDANGTVLSMTPTMSVHVSSCGGTNLGNVVFDVN